MSGFKTLDDLKAEADLTGRRVLMRVDVNVPMEDGRVTDATRIERIRPGIDELAAAGAKVILLAHLGRPEGAADPDMSLERIVPALGETLGRKVGFVPACTGDAAREAVEAMEPGDVVILENTRFNAGEEANDDAFADALAALGDVYVNDAFSAAHRAHASTEGLARRLPAFAGRTMEAELEALEAGLGDPRKPVMAVVGGAKVSTKLDLLANLVERVDILVIGGGMANTFLHAMELGVGKSLCERDLADTARDVLNRAGAAGCNVILPADVVVADRFAPDAETRTVPVDAVPADWMILDAGPETISLVNERIDAMRTLVWNGPLGAFEIEPFHKATVLCASHAARRTQTHGLVTVAGGGDTVAALNLAGVADDFTYVSTAGGAFLEWMEGKTLPGVAALARR